MSLAKYAFTILAIFCALDAERARADVVPQGQRYIPVTHTLQGTAKAADRTLLLVTVNGRNRAQCDVTPITGDGPLTVPSGYMDRSYLVALTAAQLTEMQAARQASADWKDDRASSPLRVFFERDDVAASEVLPFRALVSSGAQARSQAIAWTLAEVGDKALTLTAEVSTLDANGAPTSTSDVPWVPIGIAAAVALVLVALLVRRKKT